MTAKVAIVETSTSAAASTPVYFAMMGAAARSPELRYPRSARLTASRIRRPKPCISAGLRAVASASACYGRGDPIASPVPGRIAVMALGRRAFRRLCEPTSCKHARSPGPVARTSPGLSVQRSHGCLHTAAPRGTLHKGVWIALLATVQARLRLGGWAAARTVPSVLNVVMPAQVALPLSQPLTAACRVCCHLVSGPCHPRHLPTGTM